MIRSGDTVDDAGTGEFRSFRSPEVRDRFAALDRLRQSLDHAYFGDALAVALLLLMTVAFTAGMVLPVMAFIRGDWPTYNFPVYSFLGERLRALDIPGWNPYQFSGAPFVGDPGSGWMYLPAMAIYAFLPAEPATTVYLATHIALAAAATYCLARLLGASIAGSFVGATAFAFAWVAPASMNMVIYFPPTIMLVIALIGVEIDAQAVSWTRRLVGWVVAALAISQILAIWLGQVAYYAFLVIGAWVVYRRLLIPDFRLPLRSRLAQTALSGLAIFGLGTGFAAPSLLPALDTVSRSNLAGGIYDVPSSWADARVGYSPSRLVSEIWGGYAGMTWWYFGAIAVGLALMSPVVARRWRPMPFFVVATLSVVILALDRPTPLHALTYALLPRFANLHEHAPDRILVVAAPAVAVLAAGAVTYLPRWSGPRTLLAVVALCPGALAVALRVLSTDGAKLLSLEAIALVVATSVLAMCLVFASSRTMWQAALVGLILLALWDPAGRLLVFGLADETKQGRSLTQALAQHPDAFLYGNGAAAFLATQSAARPARYAGYEPSLLHDPATVETEAPDFGYRSWKGVPEKQGVDSLLVLYWATWFHIDDTQGYNPVQVQRYVEFIDALNGHRQEYHERDIYPGALDSPLLDLLNLRYLVVRADPPDPASVAPALAAFPVVYEDSDVRILENPGALPRAWLVHDARQIAPGEALSLLADGTIDPLQTVLLEEVPPSLAPAASPREKVVYRRDSPDRIEITVNATAPALLVLSDVWAPGWHAMVDQSPAPVYLANHVFRAVPVPAGEHKVTLTYEPPFLRLGFAMAALTLLVAVLLALGPRFAAKARGRVKSVNR